MKFPSWLTGSSIGQYVIQKFNWTSAFDSGAGEYVAAYFTAVKILSENMSKLTPYVADADGNKIEKHKLNAILGHKPNKYQNKQKFAGQVEFFRSGRGNGYAYVERDSQGYVKALHPLPSNAILCAMVKGDGQLYYSVDFNSCPFIVKVGKVDVNSDDILHFNFASGADLFSPSPLSVVGSYTNILDKASKMIDSFYANNATSAMAIETTLDKAAFFKDMSTSTDTFIEKYVGIENAGKPIRLPPNTKLVPIHQKFADAQVIETQKHAREEIANLFGIPKFMLQSENNEASIEQQTRQFLAFTINPIIEIYTCELEYKLLTAHEINLGYQIMYDTEKLVETDTKTKTDVIALQVSKGLATPNEGPKKLGNKPIDSPWANMHWVQSQNNPIEKYEVWGNNGLNPAAPKAPTPEEKPVTEEKPPQK